MSRRLTSEFRCQTLVNLARKYIPGRTFVRVPRRYLNEVLQEHAVTHAGKRSQKILIGLLTCKLTCHQGYVQLRHQDADIHAAASSEGEVRAVSDRSPELKHDNPPSDFSHYKDRGHGHRDNFMRKHSMTLRQSSL